MKSYDRYLTSDQHMRYGEPFDLLPYDVYVRLLLLFIITIVISAKKPLQNSSGP